MRHPVTAFICTLLVAGLLVSSCAPIRQVTYPPEFVYLDSAKISGAMHEMADSLYLIEDLISGIGRPDHPAGDQLDTLLLAELEGVERAANKLGTGASTKKQMTNHLLIDENLDQFLGSVAAAKLQLIATPPNYFMVGQLTGSCNACHSQRKSQR